MRLQIAGRISLIYLSFRKSMGPSAINSKCPLQCILAKSLMLKQQLIVFTIVCFYNALFWLNFNVPTTGFSHGLHLLKFISYQVCTFCKFSFRAFDASFLDHFYFSTIHLDFQYHILVSCHVHSINGRQIT